MHAWLLIAVAVAVGAAVPIQTAINARTGAVLGHPLYGALANTLIGSAVLLTLVLAFRLAPPRIGHAVAGPWWLWSGGFIGAAFVFGALYVAPRIGAAAFGAATVLGTVVASLAIDHYGLWEFPLRPLSVTRVLGAAMVLGGLLLLRSGRA